MRTVAPAWKPLPAIEIVCPPFAGVVGGDTVWIKGLAWISAVVRAHATLLTPIGPVRSSVAKLEVRVNPASPGSFGRLRVAVARP